jgi:hypothetical protein
MPLRERVGRYVETGKNCWNLEGDQQTVIGLLNRIPVTNGGTEGLLGTAVKAPIVRGLASDELYKAITFFQKKQFGTITGFIDPAGRDLSRLESLAARTPDPPPPAQDQWADLKSKSIHAALTKALDGDLALSHAEVIEIIRASLSDGMVVANELHDLSAIATRSRTMSPRSKRLLEAFVKAVEATAGSKGPFQLPQEGQRVAANAICDFLKRSGGTYFPHLSREEVGIGLLMRVAKPGLMRQGSTSLCGPAALLFNVATDAPAYYARFGIELFEKGKGIIHRLVIKPGKDCREYQPASHHIDPVDWLTLASVRDSENWFFDYDTVGKEALGLSPFDMTAGPTLPNEMVRWFQLSGFHDVRDATNLSAVTLPQDPWPRIEAANGLLARGYRVVLLINDNMLDKDEQTKGSAIPMHWVGLRAPIARTGGTVTTTVFTWGRGDYKVPQGAPLSEGDFTKNFYGYVAAKP